MFILVWLTKEDFKEKVARVWRKPVKAKTSIDKWIIKEKRMKSYLKGWG